MWIMKMPFSRHGKQFFFITLTLEKRPAALSQLIDAEHAPALLPPGKSAQDILRAIHPAFPYLTLSTNVIMPDHIHFLLIANYDLSPTFNPMWFSFVLIEAMETSWASEAQGHPTIPPVALLQETLERSYARTTEICSWGNSEDIIAAIPAKFPPRQASPLHFDRRAYIEISFDTWQLKAIRRYIRLNPARAIWKREHPDRFQCFAGIRHPVLDPTRRWSGIGNLTLLASPFLFHVRLTMKKTAEAHEDTIAAIMERAKRGEIPVSGFISDGERELLRRLKAEPQTRFIKVLPCQLPPYYDPSAEDSRELAADRMLLLSGLPNTPAIPSRDMRNNKKAAHQFRKNCLALNDRIAELCQRAQALGKTEQL
jgi:hypothetical protein